MLVTIALLCYTLVQSYRGFAQYMKYHPKINATRFGTIQRMLSTKLQSKRNFDNTKKIDKASTLLLNYTIVWSGQKVTLAHEHRCSRFLENIFLGFQKKNYAHTYKYSKDKVEILEEIVLYF
jgi:hypothetical protein